MPSARHHPDLPGFSLSFPPSVVPTGRADGAVLVIPGRPVVMEDEVTVSEAAKLTGYSVRQIQKIARGLGARQRGPRCKLRLPARAVAEMISRRA